MIIAALVGIGIGILIGSLIAKNKRQALLTQTEVLQAEIAHAQAQGETMVSAWQRQVEDVKASAREQVEQAKADGLHRLKEAKEEWDRAGREVLAAQEHRHQEAMAALQARFDETMQKVTAQVQTATDEMLRQRQKEFAEASHTNLGQIVNPLREIIDQMKKAMDENTLKQTSMSSEMRTHIEHIIQQSRAAQKSAEELTRAFKHGSKVQGDWGETILDELLESQGLTRGVHYDTQAVIRDANGQVVKSETGSLMRPDIILHLDQRREVIIDSKVSLTACMDYANAEDEEQRLSEIIKEVNSKTGKSFDSDVAFKAALQIRDLMKKNPDLIASAKSNTVNEFEYSYFTGVDDALLDGLQQNQEFFSLLLNDEALKKEVLGIFIKSIYDDLKRENT